MAFNNDGSEISSFLCGRRMMRMQKEEKRILQCHFFYELVKAAVDSLLHCRSLGASLSFVRRGRRKGKEDSLPLCSWDFCCLKDPKRRRGSKKQNFLFLFGFPFRIGCEEHPRDQTWGESGAAKMRSVWR